MDDRDPRGISEDELERRLNAAANARENTRLVVDDTEDRGWTAFYRVYDADPTMAPDGIGLLGVEGGNSRREVLEHLWTTLDLNRDFESWRRLRDA